MNYRTDRYGNRISILGYGCMRFTSSAGKINVKKAEEEILEAIRSGVNYFDTAYVYPGSEAALGEILERNGLRDEVSIATKLPHYLVKNADSIEKYFSEQLKRLRTDHVDYYLMHMLTDVKTWEKLKALGVEEWIRSKKEKGQIRQVGFSYHGNADKFIELLDAYDWDFCQIQYNYLDENSQAGRKGLMYANEKGLPVIVMEGLRGGKLANQLPPSAKKIFDDYPVKRSPAEWGLKWLWNQKQVTCVLSGMNSVDMVKENVRAASSSAADELGSEEAELYAKVIQEINAKTKVNCTGCRYCMPCPKNVDIPGAFSAYNHVYSDGFFTGLSEYFMCTAMRRDSSAASNCVSCGRCEKRCPQHIQIRRELKSVKKKLENPLYKIARGIVKIFKIY